MTRTEGRRRKWLLDDLKETKCYWNLEQEALYRTLWRTRFVRVYVSVLTVYGMNER